MENNRKILLVAVCSLSVGFFLGFFYEPKQNPFMSQGLGDRSVDIVKGKSFFGTINFLDKNTLSLVTMEGKTETFAVSHMTRVVETNKKSLSELEIGLKAIVLSTSVGEGVHSANLIQIEQ